MSTTPRRVVYIVIDGMGTPAFEQACDSGRAPALAFLKEHGSYVRDSTAVFPTITPAATASLSTGATPAQHGIPGMCWYSRDEGRLVNYGQSPRSAVIEGENQIVRDWLESLNKRHLSPTVQTIHEQLHALGLVTASVNFMVFRGPFTSKLKPDPLERLFFHRGLPRELHGPKELYIADVVGGPSKACSKRLSRRGGAMKRMRATDEFAGCVTRELLEKNAADMILFYLHENDHKSHQHGPGSQIDNLAQADEHIANVLSTYDSWDETLKHVGFVVTADHAQSPISERKDHIMDLHDVFADYRQVLPGHGPDPLKGRDLVATGNGRVGFVYLNEKRKKKLFPKVVATLRSVDGLDQVMWRAGQGFVVASDRGELRFSATDEDGVADERGNRWCYEGELGALGGVVEDDRIRTPEYPLAMWRVKSALDLDRIGDIVVTPKLTYDIKDLGGVDHRGGGDHASLHVQDSMIPFVSTLAQPPLRPTTVDVVPHIVGHFRSLRR
ncbi:MAG: alkaline phosphatase family protein [Actinobacteria bacterium]|nr:alkaline phosphatase family protein [Actinomycetota bacterium]